MHHGGQMQQQQMGNQMQGMPGQRMPGQPGMQSQMPPVQNMGG